MHFTCCKIKKSIHEETNHAIVIKMCTCLNEMNGGMTYYYLTHSLLYSPFFWHGSPTFFSSHASWHAFFSLFQGLTMTWIIQGYLFWRERLSKQEAFIDGWWMMLIPSVEILHMNMGVYMILITKAWKRILLVSHNLTKLKEITSCIWIWFCNNYSYGSGRYFHIE